MLTKCYQFESIQKRFSANGFISSVDTKPDRALYNTCLGSH